MNAIRLTAAFSQCQSTGIGTRVVVFTLVIAAHAAVWSAWNRPSATHIGRQHELSVSFALAQQVQHAAVARQQKAAPDPTPVPEKITQTAAVTEAVTVATQAAAPAATVAPVIAATEPDYKAAYLNNPPPAYPLAARRMGLQGRVLLHVEVLANGNCGHIRIERSSGYALLDNAALETVKTWRFVPAQQAGSTVDKWFIIPLQFSLRDTSA